MRVLASDLARAAGLMSGVSARCHYGDRGFLAPHADGLAVRAFDGEVLAEVVVPANGEIEACVPLRPLADFAKLLEDAAVEMREDEGKLVVEAGRRRQTMYLEREVSCPDFFVRGSSVVVEGLAQAAQRVMFSVARTPERPVLQGVSMKFLDGAIELAATSGIHLSVERVRCDAIEDGQGVLPVSAFELLPKDRPIAVFELEDAVLFEAGDVTVQVQTIQYSYPDYSRIRPAATRCVTFQVKDALAAANAVVPFADSTFHLKIEGDAVYCFANGGNGDGAAFFPAEGDVFDLCVAPRYWQSLLAMLKSGSASLCCEEGVRPYVVTLDQLPEYYHVGAPMHVKP